MKGGESSPRAARYYFLILYHTCGTMWPQKPNVDKIIHFIKRTAEGKQMLVFLF